MEVGWAFTGEEMNFYNMSNVSLNHQQIVFPRNQSLGKVGEALDAALQVLGGPWQQGPVEWDSLNSTGEPGELIRKVVDAWCLWARSVHMAVRGEFIIPQDPVVFEKAYGDAILTWDDGRGNQVPSVGHTNWQTREVGLHITATPWVHLFLVVKEHRCGVGPSRAEAILMWSFPPVPNSVIMRETADQWERSWQAAQKVGVS